MMHNDDDAFWNIALDLDYSRPIRVDSNDDNDEPSDCSPRRRTYRLSENVELVVAPLASGNNTVNSPVGAQVWHASAILAGLATSSEMNLSNIKSMLELGSGAVGLAGLAFGLQLASGSSQAILTDVNQDGILQQLQNNVTYNVERIKQENGRTTVPNIFAQELDWRDFVQQDAPPLQVPPWLLPNKLDLVIGSELVYTMETSRACQAVLQHLLKSYPFVNILILQVMDRPGFAELLERMNKRDEIDISILQPLPPKWHDRGTQILNQKEALGTLSRQDYGLVWIRRQGQGQGHNDDKQQHLFHQELFWKDQW